MVQVAFFSFVALTLGSAVGVLLTRNVLYSAYLLLLALLGVAALFVFAGADFLAVSQLVIYVGGVLILILFGIMLTQKPALPTANDPAPSERPNAVLTESRRVWLGVGLALGLFWGLSRLLVGARFRMFDRPLPPATGTIDTIGKQPLTNYALPFEVVSLLLLVALVGAGYLAKKQPETPNRTR